jgi:hypothetical protein
MPDIGQYGSDIAKLKLFQAPLISQSSIQLNVANDAYERQALMMRIRLQALFL